LANILATQGEEQQSSLAFLFADIALEDIDPILQQARALGREGHFLHVHCTRRGHQMVLLLDADARYHWLLPAVQKRLREELAKLQYELAAVETQSLDLTRGGSWQFVGFEMRLVEKGRGESRVQYQRIPEADYRQHQGRLLRRRRHSLSMRWM
jgi:RNA-directed DNA polymerase